MENEFFMYDFGFFRSDSFNKTITNPTDLFDRDTIWGVLKVCQTKENSLRNSASDYELFRALCDVRPLLFGHPLPHRCEYLLKTCFGIALPLNSDTCDEIWQVCAEKLWEHPMTLWDCIRKTLSDSSIPRLLESDRLPAVAPNGMEPVLNGNSLCDTCATSWNVWKNEMQNVLEAFEEMGCRSVYFQLPKDFCDIEPNVYSVEQALSGKRKDKNLLTAQAFRFLCEAVLSRDWSLILRAECKEYDVISLLKRAERTVGLPHLIWTTANVNTRDALLSFPFQDHKNGIQCGICLGDYPSDTELEAAISAYAARYPIGRLAVIWGGDLRYTAYERERFEKQVQTILKATPHNLRLSP